MASNMNVCFIVGHGKAENGGYDSGAVSKDGKYHEFKIAREIAKYAYEKFNELFVEQADLMNYNGSLYLEDRIKQVNAKNYAFVAEIHLNSQSGGTDANGTECYYSKGSALGQRYADKICDYISADLGVAQRKNWTDEDGGDKTKLGSSGKDYFGIIRKTKCEAVLVETVFISNKSDLKKVSTSVGQMICGEAIARAVGDIIGATPRTKPSATAKPDTPVEKPTTPVEPTDSSFKKGDLVEITANATYYGMNKKVPNWVLNTRWFIDSVSNTRAVLGASENADYFILSPIHTKYLRKVNTLRIVTGSTVKIKIGATDYNGKTLKSFVYKRKYKVKEIKGDRVVLTFAGIVVAAVNKSDIYPA